MAKTKIILLYDSERLAAIRQFSENENTSMEEILQEQIERIYVKVVPNPVRQYIEGRTKNIVKNKSGDMP